MSHAVLALLRHGQSEWNRIGRFQGWTDIGLTEEGRREAQRAAATLREHGYTFDACSSSVLRRSSDTARIVLESMSLADVPIDQSWRLNERHYGALQGMGPVSSLLRYGMRVIRCQKRYSYPPPPLTRDDPRFPGNDPRYADLAREDLPLSESLADTYRRMLPYWRERVVPELQRGGRMLLVSHKNVLRGLIKVLEGRPDEDIKHIKVPTCVPIVFEFNRDLQVVGRHQLRNSAAGASRSNGASAVQG